MDREQEINLMARVEAVEDFAALLASFLVSDPNALDGFAQPGPAAPRGSHPEIMAFHQAMDEARANLVEKFRALRAD